MIGAFSSRAASSAATAVEDEVTFWCPSAGAIGPGDWTHDGWDGKVLLLGVLEKVEDIIAHDDAGLAGEHVFGTHVRDVDVIYDRVSRSECCRSVCEEGRNVVEGQGRNYVGMMSCGGGLQQLKLCSGLPLTSTNQSRRSTSLRRKPASPYSASPCDVK